ncbi:MAG: IS200/IS605 family transposase [Peptococcaceae bacterium]|nr:IS200/IS605 family transposase [Peptococcaceae bacterium]
MDNTSLAHTKWNGIYHIVFIPKYRRKEMYGEKRVAVREILKKLCEYKNVEIVAGNVCIDHVHLCVKIPPKISVSGFMEYLKGKSALMVFDRFPEYKRKGGDRHFWARGYYVDTVGRNEEQIKSISQIRKKATSWKIDDQESWPLIGGIKKMGNKRFHVIIVSG